MLQRNGSVKGFQRRRATSDMGPTLTVVENGNVSLADDFNATSWEDLEPVTKSLLERSVENADDLESLFKDISDMAEHVSEAGAKLYIGMTCDTENEDMFQPCHSWKIYVQKCQRSQTKFDLKIANLEFSG